MLNWIRNLNPAQKLYPTPKNSTIIHFSDIVRVGVSNSTDLQIYYQKAMDNHLLIASFSFPNNP